MTFLYLPIPFAVVLVILDGLHDIVPTNFELASKAIAFKMNFAALGSEGESLPVVVRLCWRNTQQIPWLASILLPPQTSCFGTRAAQSIIVQRHHDRHALDALLITTTHIIADVGITMGLATLHVPGNTVVDGQ